MKKIIAVIITVILCFSLQLPAFAEELPDATSIDVTVNAPTTPENASESVENTAPDNLPTEAPQPPPDEAGGATETPYHTIFTRIWEYTNEHQQTIIDVAGFAVLFVMSVWSAILRKKNNAVVKNSFSQMGFNTTSVAKSQQDVVGVVNALIGGYEKLDNSYNEFAKAEDERNRLVGAMVVQNATILEILTSVYVNSKNLPQGVKDIVHLKYAKCLKTLEDDEKLRACVLAVRDIVNEEDSTKEV